MAFDAVTGNQLWAHIQASGLRAGPLWLGPKGPLTEQGVYKVVKRCIVEAGLDRPAQAPAPGRLTHSPNVSESRFLFVKNNLSDSFAGMPDVSPLACQQAVNETSSF